MKQKTKLFVSTSFLILAVLGLWALPQSAHAASFWDGLGTAISNVLVGTLDIYFIPAALILQVVQMITGVLPVVAGEIFRIALILNDNIDLTPLKAGSQDMVSVGFNFTRDLANMSFILILAWVGFATILRLETYEIKKLLPKLIIIALLINFIPIITGVILDLASIVTQIFADKSNDVGLYMWELLPAQEIIQTGNFAELFDPTQGAMIGMAVTSLMGIAFNLIAFFMLELYAIIFIVRIVAIWILIVLAPLAWLGYIIPEAKKLWDMWWKQFIQWAIIGVPLTFFLYLSTFVLSSSSFKCQIDEVAIKQYGFWEELLSGILGEGIICKSFPFIAGVVVMLVGFILSITLAPQGADKIFQGAKKGGLAAAKVGGTTFAKGPLKAYGKGLGNFITAKPIRDSIKNKSWSPMKNALKDWGSVGLANKPRTKLDETGKLYDSFLNRNYGISSKEPSRLKAAGNGVWKAIKGSTKAGFMAGFGIKAKKNKTGKNAKSSKMVPCPTCKGMIAENAAQCTHCGDKFE